MSNPIKIEGTKIINAIATGNKYNQHNDINWSYLNLGKVALNQTNINANIQVLRPKIIDWRLITDSFTNNSGKL